MKKIFNSLVSLTLVFTLLLNFGSMSFLHAIQEGEKCFGFKLNKQYEYQGYPVLVFEHEKTGAVVVVKKNDNIEKSFSVSLRTPAENDKGTNHVLEHCVAMSGSKSVKTNQLLHDLQKFAYCTSINAFTTPCCTSYPVSSYDEDELNTLADFYVDAVFNSNFFEDERLFKREGIRFELDEQQKLKPNGRAFNEINRPSTFNQKKELEVLYPDTKIHFIAGGHPINMMDLTIQDLYDTYKKYYHPSNSLFILSGDMNYEKTLEWLNEKYLSKFEKKDMSFVDYKTSPIPEQKNFISSKVFVDSTAKNQNSVSCYYKINTHSLNLEKKLKKLREIIADDSSETHKYLKSLGYTKFMLGSLDLPFSQYVFLQLSADSKELLEESFIRNASKEAFKRVSIDQQTLDSQNSRDEFNEYIEKCSTKSYKSLPNERIINSFVETLDPISNKYFEKSENKILDPDDVTFSADEFNADIKNTLGTIEPIISVVEASSDPNDSSEKQLEKKLESMECDKEKLTKDYLEQKEWASPPTSEEALEQIKSRLKSFSEIKTPEFLQDVEKYDMSGKPCYTAKSDVDDLLNFSFFFNVNHLDKEDLIYLKIFNLLINQVGINDCTYESTKKQKEDKLNFQIGGPTLSIKADKQQQAIYSLSFTTTKDKLEDAKNLFKQTILSPNFKEHERILTVIKEKIDELQSYGTKIQKATDECNKCGNEVDAYKAQVSISEYLKCLKKIHKEISNTKSTFNLESKLLEIRNKVLSQKTFISGGIVANSENTETSKEIIKEIFEALPDTNVELKSINIPKGKQDNFIANIDGYPLNIIGQCFSFDNYENEHDLKIFSKILLDYYLNPSIMNSLGAYGMICYSGSNSINYMSLFNPNIKETIKIFEKSPDFLETFEISQENLDFICKSFISSYLSLSNLKLNIAVNQIESTVKGEKETFCSTCNNSIAAAKNFKPEKIKEFSKVFKEVFLNKNYSTIVITPDSSLSLDNFNKIEID